MDRKNVILLSGAGQIGMAIARRMGYGMKIIIGDIKIENAEKISKIMNDAGYDAEAAEMDLSDRNSIKSFIAKGQNYGDIKMLVNAAGVSPSQASIQTILKVDLYGTAVLLEEVGKVYLFGRRRNNNLKPIRQAYATAHRTGRRHARLHPHRRAAVA